LAAATAWAGRSGILVFDWIPEQLELHVLLTQFETDTKFYLTGSFPDYKELPPIWSFCSEKWVATRNQKDFPKPKPLPITGGASIFHIKPVICAPFNRLAFAEHEGPHSDWGGPPQWQTCAANYTRATTVGDMLGVIWTHFIPTRGRMNDVG
jgi:hypothetical protein